MKSVNYLVAQLLEAFSPQCLNSTNFDCGPVSDLQHGLDRGIKIHPVSLPTTMEAGSNLLQELPGRSNLFASELDARRLSPWQILIQLVKPCLCFWRSRWN